MGHLRLDTHTENVLEAVYARVRNGTWDLSRLFVQHKVECIHHPKHGKCTTPKYIVLKNRNVWLFSLRVSLFVRGTDDINDEVCRALTNQKLVTATNYRVFSKYFITNRALLLYPLLCAHKHKCTRVYTWTMKLLLDLVKTIEHARLHFMAWLGLFPSIQWKRLGIEYMSDAHLFSHVLGGRHIMDARVLAIGDVFVVHLRAIIAVCMGWKLPLEIVLHVLKHSTGMIFSVDQVLKCSSIYYHPSRIVLRHFKK